MTASAAIAAIAPVHLFLIVYAVLGPLHYLTEISWLHDRQYFTPARPMRRLWLTIVAAATIAIVFGFVSSDLLGRPVAPSFEIGLVYLAFMLAGAALFIKRLANGVALTIGALILLAMMAGHRSYAILAYLLITMIHVFVFTACFVLFGALKSGSRSGVISLGVFIACALALLVTPAPMIATSPPVRALYADFEQLNGVLAHLFGGRVTDAAIMRLIAFAYTYHYLNWFSKTSIIRWHEVPRTRAVAIVALWLGGMALYAINYQHGFAAFYVLSVLHVLLEFPLNHQTFVGIARALRPRVAEKATPLRPRQA